MNSQWDSSATETVFAHYLAPSLLLAAVTAALLREGMTPSDACRRARGVVAHARIQTPEERLLKAIQLKTSRRRVRTASRVVSRSATVLR